MSDGTRVIGRRVRFYGKASGVCFRETRLSLHMRHEARGDGLVVIQVYNSTSSVYRNLISLGYPRNPNIHINARTCGFS
jgi:hypothetical protein